MNQQRFDSLLHHHIATTFIQNGHAPNNEQLAQKLGVPVEAVESGLTRLDASHGVVLDPGQREIWVVHPFSSSPTHA
ncbi:hypothetical protein SAMN05414139_10065 [Burkholderia sp. D7]|jgi:hypothetical protein|nr:hypothetical protein SAMN05414139_10065 [Burkholderia sp. D7]